MEVNFFSGNIGHNGPTVRLKARFWWAHVFTFTSFPPFFFTTSVGVSDRSPFSQFPYNSFCSSLRLCYATTICFPLVVVELRTNPKPACGPGALPTRQCFFLSSHVNLISGHLSQCPSHSLPGLVFPRAILFSFLVRDRLRQRPHFLLHPRRRLCRSLFSSLSLLSGLLFGEWR